MIRTASIGKTVCLASILSFFVSACGIRVPQMNEDWEPADINDSLAYRIKKSLYCELVTAVRKHGGLGYILRGKKAQALPIDWGVQMTVTLTVDETGALNPSGSYLENLRSAADPLAPMGTISQSFTLPFSAQLSSEAVRIDTYYSFFTVASLIHPPKPPKIDTSCIEYNSSTGQSNPLDRSGSSYLLSGNVGMESWLVNALEENDALPSSKIPKSKTDVLQYNIKFVVITAGTASPMWKLAPVSANVGSMPLLTANRTRTHQLLITLGPVDTKDGKASPAGQAASLHETGQLEQAISSGLRSVIAH